jgi:hypothetical protein
MQQGNLFVASALCVGFDITWRIDHTHPEEQGTFTSRLKWAKRPSGTDGYSAIELAKDEHELLPTFCEIVCNQWDWPEAKRRLPNSLKHAHRQNQDYYDKQRPRTA